MKNLDIITSCFENGKSSILAKYIEKFVLLTRLVKIVLSPSVLRRENV